MTLRQRLRAPRFWRMILIGEFSWRRVLRSLLFIYAVMLIVAVFFPYRIIFQPPRASYGTNTTGLVFFAAHDGTRLAALHLPARGGAPTFVYFHGNAEDIGMMRPLFEALNELNYGVFAYDYRGYGLSGGRPNEHTAYADTHAALHYVTNVIGIAPSNMIVHGRSLGGAMAVYLAVVGRPRALILESTFTSAYRVVARVPLFPWDKFPSLKRIPYVTCPVLVMHGTDDWIVRPWHGRALYAAARAPKQAWWVEGAGHNDVIPTAGEEYFARLRAFLSELGAARAQ